jgi:lipoyl(octanoyl) transferase
MGTCRLVIEPEPQSGVRNMAIDEALLEAALERHECTVRWYRWETATVSLGYFQNSDAAAAIPGLDGLPVVRRLTGGGAILHHHEWTYSCAVPAGHPLAQTPLRIYELVHERIIAALAGLGITSAALRGTSLPSREGEFLCFGRGDPRDIVLGGHKIVGSAQRRRRGAVLQHGSLLLRRSEYARQFPGVLDLATGIDIDGDFIRASGECMAAVFGTPAMAAAHEQVVEERFALFVPRYRTLDWRRRPSEHH